MTKGLDFLERLQELDLRIFNLKKLQIDLPKRMIQLKTVVDSESTDLTRLKNQTSIYQNSKSSAELDLTDARGKLKHAEEKLAQISNNTEYQAAQKEIKAIQKQIQDLEASVLSFQERTDASFSSMKTAEEVYSKHISEYESQKNDSEKNLSDIDNQILKHEGMRGDITKDIPRPLLSIYERIRKGLNGQALAYVVGGICQACHRTLTPQKQNMVRRGEEIFQCDNCQRILILK